MTVRLTSSFRTNSGTEGSWLPDGNFPSRIQPSRVSLTSSVSLFLCGRVSSGINTDDRTSHQSYQSYVRLTWLDLNHTRLPFRLVADENGAMLNFRHGPD